jgi:hypothetical protein
MTKWKGRAASLAPSVLACGSVLIAGTGSPVLGDTVDTVQTTALESADDVDHTITGTGMVLAFPPGGTAAVEITSSGYSSTLANNGIIATAGSAADLLAGIATSGTLSGTVSNTGSVSAAGGATADHRTLGIYVPGTVSGTISNSGSISAANFGTGTILAYGIETGDITGQLSSSGTIASSAEGDLARARGLMTGAVSGTLTSSGSITLIATSDTHASADGFQTGEVSGLLENTGSISMTVRSGGQAQANDGLEIGGVSGTLINRGNITALIEGGPGARASIDGIETGTVSGDVTNAGAISITLTGGDTGADAIEIGTLQSGAAFVNTGVLTVDSHAVNSSTGNDVLEFSSIAGTAANSGALTLTASGSATVSASGIAIRGQAGTFGNSGTVAVTGTSTGEDAEIWGIEVQDLDGILTNSGRISVKADAAQLADATAVYATGETTGQLTSSGDLTATASSDDYAWAAGMDFGSISGLVENHGAIQAVSSAETADALGISAGDLLAGGSLLNTGSVSATANGQDLGGGEGGFLPWLGTGYAYASALDLGDIAAGAQAVNTGSLNAQANLTGSGFAESFGLYAGFVDGSLINSGGIQSRTNAEDGNAVAYGIYADGIGGGAALANSGTILAEARADSGFFANATGIAIDEVAGRFANSGAVSASSAAAAAGEAGTIALGIELTSLTSTAEAENSGTIMVSADNSDDFTTAIGIASNIAEPGSRLTHSGTISATASGPSAQAYGIFAARADGTIKVTGDISAAGDDEAYAILLETGTGTLNVETTADITGTIGIGRHDVNLTHAGGNAIFRFEDADTAAGAFTTAVAVPNGAWFADGAGGAAPVYTAYEAQGLQPNLDESFAIAGLTGILAGQLGSSQPGGGRSLGFAEGTGARDTSPYPYVLVTTSRSTDDGTSGTPALDSSMHSISTGVTAEADTGLRIGAGFSLVRNSGTYDGNGFDTDGVLFSAMAAQDFGWAELSAGLGAGRFDHQSTRAISGSADAQSDYGSTMLVSRLGLRRAYDAGNGVVLTPEASVIYGRQDYDGYTETGSSANATIGARKSTFTEARLGTGFTAPAGSGLLRGSLAAVHRDADGPSSVSVSIFGDTVALSTPGGSRDTFGELALGWEAVLPNGGEVRVGGLATLGAQTQTRALAASYSFKF